MNELTHYEEYETWLYAESVALMVAYHDWLQEEEVRQAGGWI